MHMHEHTRLLLLARLLEACDRTHRRGDVLDGRSARFGLEDALQLPEAECAIATAVPLREEFVNCLLWDFQAEQRHRAMELQPWWGLRVSEVGCTRVCVCVCVCVHMHMRGASSERGVSASVEWQGHGGK